MLTPFRIKIIFIVAALAIMVVAFSAARVQYRVWATKERIRQLEAQITALGKDNASISGLIGSLDDPVRVEREARSRLNLRKQDEEVVVLIPQDAGEGQREERIEVSEASEAERSNFVKWWKKFFDDAK